jgi:hypothetical protein
MKAHRENLTTFRSNWTDNEILRRISLPYFPKITNKLSKHFRKHKIQLVTNSNNYKIKNKLGSVKDQVNDNNKSGIYQISCGTRGCNLKYIGQSRRAIQTRFVDHLRSFKNNHPENSAVVHHTYFTDDDQPRRCKQKFDISNLELIHHVPDQRHWTKTIVVVTLKKKPKVIRTRIIVLTTMDAFFAIKTYVNEVVLV